MIGALFVLLATLAFAAGPFLVPNFGGFSPDLFPVPQIQPPIQPAGWAFAIWGLIYLWLLVSAVFGLWVRARNEDWFGMRPALILSMALGAAWLPFAQANPLLAAVMIWAMLLTALGALFRAPKDDRLMASWPIGLYAGWLSAASCVATGICLAGYGILDEVLAAQAMIAFGIVLAAGVQLKLGRSPTYGMAVIWALSAIYVVNDGQHGDVAALAVVGVITLAALTCFAAVKDLRPKDI
ncbi:MAG: TspO/MBR family protein [Aliishimia sp.]